MVQYIPLIAGIAVAGLLVLLTGRWFQRAAWRIGMIDRPKLRGVHADPVARSGGMTVVIALLGALLVQMLVAQALAEDMALISNDEQLDRYGIERIW